MKRSSLLLAGVLLSSALPLAARADNQQGWYGAVTGGISSYGNSQDDENDLQNQLASEGIQADVHVDDNPAAIALGIGYHFDENFALEADWLDLGQATAHVHAFSPSDFFIHEDAEASGLVLDAYGLIPVSRRVSLFGKLGLFNYSLDENLSSDQPLPPPTHFSASGTTWDLGVGVEIHFTPGFGMRAGFSSYRHVGDANTTGRENIGLGYAQLYVNF
jgi:OOP family OmpA-OmpF porin